MSKKKGVIEKVLEFLWKHIQSIILIIGSVILSIFAVRKYFDIKGITKTKWKKIPGTNIRVQVQNKDKEWEEVGLPIVNGTQLTTNDIRDIRKTEKEGEYAAKIKHKIRDRRNITVTDITITDNNTSMDV